MHHNRPPSTSAIALLRRSLVLLALASLVAGCGVVVNVRSLFGERVDLEVEIGDQLNENSPVAMEYLLVEDEQLLERLLAMSAREWFENRDQIRKNYPDGTGFYSELWEWTPGEQTVRRQLPLRSGAEAGIIFVSYQSEGMHRVRVHPRQDLRVRLGFEDFTIEPM